MVKSLGLLLLLALTPLLMAADSRDVPGFGGIDDVSGFVSGSGRVDITEVITTIYSGQATYPNAYVDSADYDIINQASDGSTIKYGYLSRLAKDTSSPQDYTIYTRGTENERELDSDGVNFRYVCMVWFSLEGVNAGDRINDAFVYINSGGTNTVEADGAYYACRLDTVLADYAITDSTPQTPDLCLLGCSWNHMDAPLGSVPFTPPLDDRLNWYGFGPRSRMLAGDELDGTQGGLSKFDVTEPLQQHVDRGQDAIDLGALFVFYAVNQQVNGILSAGTRNWVGDLYNGNPALTVTTSNQRGTKAWGTNQMPVAFTWDDGKPAQVGFYNTLDGDGVQFDMDVPESVWAAAEDSLYSNTGGKIDFAMSARTGRMLGPTGDWTGAGGEIRITDEEINYQLERDWVNSTNFTLMPDTSAFQMDFVWNGGDPEKYGLRALWKLAGYRYRSGRASNIRRTDACAVGSTMNPSWDSYTNIYTIGARSINNITNFGGTIATDPDEIIEHFKYYIDELWTDYGRSAAVLLGHDSVIDKVSIALHAANPNLDVLQDFVNGSHFLKRTSYDYIVGNLRDRGFYEVEEVAIMASSQAGVSFQDSSLVYDAFFTATKQDSCAVVDGTESLFNIMWVGPASD